jgi:hypothetical protein
MIINSVRHGSPWMEIGTEIGTTRLAEITVTL